MWDKGDEGMFDSVFPICPYCKHEVDVHVDQIAYSWVHDQDIHAHCYESHEREQNDEQSRR
jgi:hypothetical protein